MPLLEETGAMEDVPEEQSDQESVAYDPVQFTQGRTQLLNALGQWDPVAAVDLLRQVNQCGPLSPEWLRNSKEVLALLEDFQFQEAAE